MQKPTSNSLTEMAGKEGLINEEYLCTTRVWR